MEGLVTANAEKTESIRLVIWDLDEVFWKGTLTEGGIEYLDHCHDTVITLAKRGIMSSVCSKNEFSQVERILKEKGIWEFFIFPSINWAPKGDRICSLIAATQLRSPTVLFIDDNAMNIAEALHCAPGIQVSDESILPTLLYDARLLGKPDPEMTRLAHYKVLETKKRDEDLAVGDNQSFLRSSGIKVTIDYDVASNIDRAIEIINRTNQLNFTKVRLSEDQELARSQLSEAIAGYDAFSGLIKVSDKYGDYGNVGFFLTKGHAGKSVLKHYCFSCRTMGMGIETWLYNRLGRPLLKSVGEVLVDVINDRRTVDWVEEAGVGAEAESSSRDKMLHSVVLRGGCDLGAIAHYLRPLATNVHLELFVQRDDRAVRMDHSAMLRIGLSEQSPPVDEALTKVGYEASDWNTQMSRLAGCGERKAWILSFWMDSLMVLYRHRALGFAIPFAMPREPMALTDVTRLPQAELDRLLVTEEHRALFKELSQNYEALGRVDEQTFRSTLKRLLINGAKTEIFILLGPESVGSPPRLRPNEAKLNSWIKSELGGSPNVHLLDVLDFTEPGDGRQEALHFDRLVYKRVADEIIRRLAVRFDRGTESSGCPRSTAS
jgi:FkbH-like protein